ncbi:hypothetical protein ASPVEDRAFT_44284 [Aspergillus versicolor CBS 583.65]|uniref:C2H2-type domain-containing protein n=1 Tax=Aspergillus versicolor CBS 583.65 TaxID=1036611 RepID=A0A1L9PT97_ASPVE|nr:uncharacterized protein ASPVEDRAFT_44284 [Aspergillus versicolor CBS 583.65]OJJ04757.1 hypothetical protein ASPVEDRAFT_44284 [Aspergillus versicolor CBS 583.65]
MPPVRFGPGQILEYNERYGVLICHECQYAIQKSALQSHLLRHKIYRADRQQLLSFISELNILEPDHVVLPSPESQPIDGLPVMSGYRCTAAGCANLCASIKRMKGHWRESHGIIDTSLARPAKLQTFFRGTKISYFEVTPVDAEYDGSDNDDDNDNDADMEDIGHVEPSPVLSPTRLDLETLSYFHHFTSTTNLTLPSRQSTLSANKYWQRVVSEALSRQYLMYGLLALSACHLAAFPDNRKDEQRHRTRASEFSSEFRTGREETTADVKEIVTHIECLLRCAHWALAESPSDQRIMPESGVPDQLQSIMTTIQASVTASQDLPEETPAYSLRLLSWNPSDPGGLSPGNNIPAEICDRLRALPSHMADTFGRPENPQDVLCLLSAVASLVECCDMSFSSDQPGSAWWGMATWVNRLPARFTDLVANHDPAVLVVVAHWAALLVNRAENCGCWCVRGLAMTTLLRIAERLPADDGGVQRLIALTVAR